MGRISHIDASFELNGKPPYTGFLENPAPRKKGRGEIQNNCFTAWSENSPGRATESLSLGPCSGRSGAFRASAVERAYTVTDGGFLRVRLSMNGPGFSAFAPGPGIRTEPPAASASCPVGGFRASLPVMKKTCFGLFCLGRVNIGQIDLLVKQKIGLKETFYVSVLPVTVFALAAASTSAQLSVNASQRLSSSPTFILWGLPFPDRFRMP